MIKRQNMDFFVEGMMKQCNDNYAPIENEHKKFLQEWSRRRKAYTLIALAAASWIAAGTLVVVAYYMFKMITIGG